MTFDEWATETKVPDWARGICALTWGAVETELAALLPGSYYTDPPDGGDVSVLEQVRRMSLDAARYRLFFDAFFADAQNLPLTPRQQATLNVLDSLQPITGVTRLSEGLDKVLQNGPP
jgi:hypothetical protein